MAEPVVYAEEIAPDAIIVSDILTYADFMQLYPVFIATFMVMTSLFNKDFKGIVWLGCAIVGVAMMHGISGFFKSSVECVKQGRDLIPKLAGVANLSVSSFFILFTLM